MDNPTRWNITNSAQNIVSALVDPSKQFDSVFRREWSNSFAGFSRTRLTSNSKLDAELKTRLTEYVTKLDNRKYIRAYESQHGIESSSTSDKQNQLVVPEIFMREDFDLSNLSTFTKVIPIAEKKRFIDTVSYVEDIFQNQSTDIDNQSLFTKEQLRNLQQSFTDYLDVIEENLSSQISNRSGDFFQVMSSVDSVMDELSLAIKRVTILRKKCAKLNSTLILPNMKSIELNRTRNNAQLLLDKMNEISYLCKVQPMIQILLSASDFVGALDLIAKSRLMLHKDLTKVISLRHLESQLVEIERMIATMMQQEFLTLISSEWDGCLSQQSSAASRLSKLFDYFANEYSELKERGSLTLLSLLQIQAEKFVNQFHEERKKRVESALDIECWKVVEVPIDFQQLIRILVDEEASIGDIFSTDNYQQSSLNGTLSSRSSDIALTSLDCENNIHSSLSQAKNLADYKRIGITDDCNLDGSNLKKIYNSERNANESKNYVDAGGKAYAIVNSVIYLIRTVMDYCKCAHDIRSLSADLLERLFKILQLYNSKTYHLVYSAGAIHVAGLKTITTRSLILSQRSLKLIIMILPAIQRHFSQLLPGDNRLKRFDEIRTAYEEHAGKIPERVKSVVKDVINLQLQEWEARPPVPSEQFNAVAQHLTRLHDNIQDTLPNDELKSLFIEIGETFKEVLIKHLIRLNITHDAGPQQWLVTQELTFYKITLSKLGALKGSETNFDDLWQKLSAAINQVKTNSDKHASMIASGNK